MVVVMVLSLKCVLYSKVALVNFSFPNKDGKIKMSKFQYMHLDFLNKNLISYVYFLYMHYSRFNHSK